MNYLEKVPLADPSAFNTGLSVPSPSYMEHVLGWPRPSGQMSSNCRPVTHPQLKKRLKTIDFGPFRATCFDLFGKVFKRALDKVQVDHPELHRMLGTEGALCCRFIRGTHVPSNHSWGCAIDMKVGNVLVPLGADWTLRGMLVLYPYLHEEGLYSGMGYKHRKDSMHFEASEELIEKWRKLGMLY